MGGSVDIQALRYAALVSRWSFEDVRQQAEGYWKTTGAQHGTFAQEVEAFCDAGSIVNADQRVILAGRDLKPRLTTMALWLRKHAVDVTVVAISVLKDGAQLYLQPQVVIPLPSEAKLQTAVSIGSSDKPWLVDGQQWHLEQRCSPKGRKVVEALVELIAQAVPDADGPNWNQKFYVSWRLGSKNWLLIQTQANQATLDVGGFSATVEQVAKELDFKIFDENADMSEKLKLGSSVGHGTADGWLSVIIKSAKDVEGGRAVALTSPLRGAWEGFSGHAPTTATVEE